MDLVRQGVIAVALFVATPVAAQDMARWQAEVREASLRFGVPEAWIWRVMRVESGGHVLRDGRPIRSRKGAMGLMQLMPGTWADMRAQHGLGDDPDDPRDNILAGTAYLRAMYDRFGYPGMFAAYNAGPARHLAWLERRQALPGETIAYLAAVAVERSTRTNPKRARDTAAAPIAPANNPPWRSLFVPLSGQGQKASTP